jgi:hypothetical protein
VKNLAIIRLKNAKDIALMNININDLKGPFFYTFCTIDCPNIFLFTDLMA